MLLGLGLSYAQDSTRSSGWIVIPANEYGSLRARAFPTHETDLPPAVEATLTRVDYELKINGDIAQGRANLTVDVLKDGWVRVPVPRGLLVRQALLEGKPIALIPGAQLTALLQRKGREVLALDVGLPVTTTAGEQRLALPPSSSGVTRASITLSRQDMDIRVSGGFLAEKAEAAAESKWLAFGGGNEPLTFTWRRKIEERKVELPLRLRGSLTQLFGLGEDSTSIYAEVSADVVQGAAREVKLDLPGNVTINQVLGATIADWEVKNGQLTVKFLEPVEQSARFVITGDCRLPRDGSIKLPLMRLLDVERDAGGVAVEVQGAGEFTKLDSPGLETVDAAELGQFVAGRQSPSLAAFRFRPGSTPAARSITVQVARYEQQAVLTANIEEARYRVLMTKDGKTLVEARFAVRNNQRNFVKVTLPPGAVLWSAAMSGRPVRPGQTTDGGLLLPLAKSRAGEDAAPFPVELLYMAPGVTWAEKSKATLALPALDLPVSRTGVMLFYPPAYRVAAETGVFRTEPFAPPKSAALIADFSPPFAVAQPAAADPAQLPINAAATQALVDRYRQRVDASRAAGSLPAHIAFPDVGPSIFLVSELTGENQAPSVSLAYQHESKGGLK